MKKSLKIISIVLILMCVVGVYLYYGKIDLKDNAQKYEDEKAIHEIVRDGDIIFQTSLSAQSQAIQLATNSSYSHCGIIFRHKNDVYVFEAVQPVKLTRLYDWIERGEDGMYVLKRLKDADKTLTQDVLIKMTEEGEKFMNKDYDLAFGWSDEKIYCSELIWKIYQRATGLKVGNLQKLGDFNLDHDVVKKKLIERYGNDIPTDEMVISPQAIFESELLVTVKAD